MNTCIETQLEELTKRVQALEQNITFVQGLTPVTASGAGTKHTPGPWAIEYRTEDEFTYSPRIYAGPAVLHYSAGYHTEEQDAKFKEVAEANARLIAAAPELLESLILLKQAVEFTPLGTRGIKAVEQARAVIAKATGSAS